MTEAKEYFHHSLLAFGHGEVRLAAELAAKAARQEPESRVFSQAAKYLARVLAEGRAQVYDVPAAFSAFIQSGGNIQLYEAVSSALRRVYQEYDSLSLLDIGAGDGRALLPALTANVVRLEVIEPSAAMLGALRYALDECRLPYCAFNGTLQQFTQHSKDQREVIQATFSLQSVHPAERPALFRWLRAHGRRLLIVEFDVPQFTEMYAPEHVQYVLERYERGLAEYPDDDLVAQGFLIPVMFGYFDPTAERTNYEQPIRTWMEQLQEAGFTQVTAHSLSDYWWATAFLIDARH
ncbi:MAG TPA: class I SAM-dependent methyltransferase [Blastocatellia bacterium]|nr:class I SAM-dependent methyltransferase [Blastocatellia bacterium]